MFKISVEQYCEHKNDKNIFHDKKKKKKKKQNLALSFDVDFWSFNCK